jgi:tetratricopeptide (TPR) repeat protein
MKKHRWILACLLLLSPPLYSQDAYQRGLEALSRQDTAAAQSAFHDALTSGRRRTDAARALARLSYHAGDLTATKKYLDQLLSLSEKDADGLLLYGNLMARTGHPRKALAYYRKASQRAPKNPNVRLSLGKALIEIDSAQAAVVQLSVAKIYAPKTPAVYESLGDAYARIGVVPLAMANYNKALSIDKKNTRLRMKVAGFLIDNRRYNDAESIFKSIHAIDTAYADAYLQGGILYSRAKMYRHALPSLRKYRALSPTSPAADTLNAVALMETGLNGEASRFFRKELARDSSSVEYWRMYTRALIGIRQYDNAVSAFAALRRRSPLTAEDDRLLAQVQKRLGKEQEAITALEDAIAIDTVNCEQFYDLGSLYMKAREYEKAAHMFERRIRCDSNSIGAYLNAGSCYLAIAGERNDRSVLLSRARDLLTVALDRAPEYLPTRQRLASYFALVDSFDLAKQENEAIIKVAEKNPKRYRSAGCETYAQLATYYSYKKEPERALSTFQKAHMCGCDNATMELNWGIAFLETVDPQKTEQEKCATTQSAADHLRRSIGLDQKNAKAHYWLGVSLLRLRIPGDNASIHSLTAQACKEFQTALRLDPGNEEVKKELRLYGCK